MELENNLENTRTAKNSFVFQLIEQMIRLFVLSVVFGSGHALTLKQKTISEWMKVKIHEDKHKIKDEDDDAYEEEYKEEDCTISNV